LVGRKKNRKEGIGTVIERALEDEEEKEERLGEEK